MNYSTVPPELLKDISNRAISSKPVNWGYIERICSTFDDILLVVNHAIKVGVSFSGIPGERTEKFLLGKGINLRSLQ
jgi:hypothetical protein